MATELVLKTSVRNSLVSSTLTLPAYGENPNWLGACLENRRGVKALRVQVPLSPLIGDVAEW